MKAMNIDIERENMTLTVLVIAKMIQRFLAYCISTDPSAQNYNNYGKRD